MIDILLFPFRAIFAIVGGIFKLIGAIVGGIISFLGVIVSSILGLILIACLVGLVIQAVQHHTRPHHHEENHRPTYTYREDEFISYYDDDAVK